MTTKVRFFFAVIATIQCGCASRPRFQPNGDVQLIEPRSQPKDQLPGQPYEFSFGGIYEIDAVTRTGTADTLAPRIARNDQIYEDGGIAICIHPVPFGVRLRLTNKLSDSITLMGKKCSMIDVNGRAWSAELRDPAARFPTLEPISQELTIPEASSCEIDLDVILPRFREAINRRSRSDEERGAFMAKDGPLPVFSSGFFAYPANPPSLRDMEGWALNQFFRVHIEFEATRGHCAYTFVVKPLEFTTGPDAENDKCKYEPHLAPL